MLPEPLSMPIPLSTQANGAICISGTRITLDVLLARHRQGDSPEAIQQAFPSLALTDVYAVLAYYLAHRSELDDYLRQRAAARAEARRTIEARYSPEERAFTERLRGLLAAKHEGE